MLIKLAWFTLALVHALPAAVFFRPALVAELYGVDALGETGILLVHRGALFLAVLLASLLAAFDPPSRRAASCVAAVSMLGFLIVYARSGLPPGPLRTIAVVDLVALVPLAAVLRNAWSGRGATASPSDP